MPASGDPFEVPCGLFSSLSDRLVRWLDAQGIEHDGVGTLQGPYSPVGTLVLASPDVTILGATQSPGSHPEAPNLKWSVVIRLATGAQAPATVTRHPAIDADAIRENVGDAVTRRVELSREAERTRQRLWAAYTRWRDHFGAQVRDSGRPNVAARLRADRERVQLDDGVRALLRQANDHLEALTG